MWASVSNKHPGVNKLGIGGNTRGRKIDNPSGRYPVLVTRQDGELQGAPFGSLGRQPATHREQQDKLAAPARCRVESVTESGIGRRRQRRKAYVSREVRFMFGTSCSWAVAVRDDRAAWCLRIRCGTDPAPEVSAPRAVRNPQNLRGNRAASR